MPEQDPTALAPAFALAARYQRERRAGEQREHQLDESHRHHGTRLSCPAVLAEEVIERAVVLDARRQRHDLLGRGAVDVHQLCSGQVHTQPRLASGRTNRSLREEEIVLRHRPDLFDHSRRTTAGAPHGFDFDRLLMLVALRG
jgi:hypothetical protein